MYYIGLDVHKRTVSYCVKDVSGTIHAEGTLPATRFYLDQWIATTAVDRGDGSGSRSRTRTSFRTPKDFTSRARQNP